MSLENDFYLTGGTALHRFYLHSRYSVDLDFFVSNAPHFYEDFNEILESIKAQGFSVKQEVSFRDFYRIRINEDLQVDFVNDRVYRYGKSNVISGFRIDSPLNILANKITALVSRDEEKDFYDICCCALNMDFNWHTLLEIANKKALIEKETLIYRLKCFPLPWLSKIKTLKPFTITPEIIETMCDDILKESTNNLYKQK
ncbi:MAG TPA: nucleotidyl transferase AbiEii/AbiGii toxin family protein [Termitinemataceae bacterium]|nr:nucleotidyl transferase AbiEii/AbiGii toxin family protein [Termitinemataceae bacterium]